MDRKTQIPSRVDSKIVEGSLAGSFLVAGPALRDPRFHKAVVYMCVHDAEQAMGIIINKPKPDVKLSTMLPHLEIEGKVTNADTPVLYGGPVETERGFILHTRDFMDENNSLPLGENLALSTSKSVLKSLTSPQAPKKAILSLGYAGWHAGQLESEIANNSWFVTPANDDIIFSGDANTKWTQVMFLAGITPEFLSREAGHA
ncbi:MAG TPA: YqgE/AlgH family protein [Hellea balneolensis]|uniref:UPF0301 protein ENJ42_09270 n=1 Tax=Hellea balneolensis TaxID=287478 RepID=A0A7C5LY50_9PROT|nr:YqgE/AlgH family protein [Hellea balneolensis]